MLNTLKIIFLTNKIYIFFLPLIIIFLCVAGVLELLGISTFIVFIASFFNSQVGIGSNKLIILINEYLNYFEINKELIPIIACLLIISGSLILVFINLLTQSFIASIERNISSKIFNSLVYDETNKFLDNNLKNGANQVIVNDIYAFSAVLISLFQIFSKSILIIVFSIYVYISLKANIGYGLIIIFLISFFIFFFLYNKTRKIGSEMHKRTFELFSYLKNLSGMSKLLSLYSNKNKLIYNYKSIVYSISNSRKINSFLANSNKNFMEIFLLIILILYFHIKKELNIESFLLLSIVAVRLFPYFNSVQVSLNQLNMYKDYSINILKYLDNNYEIKLEKKNLIRIKYFRQIEYHINNFQYPKDGYSVSSKIYKFDIGKKYIIKGANAKGKTTLLNLISLNILFDGKIFTYKYNSIIKNYIQFRKKFISFSPQTDHFIEGTVNENLSLFSNKKDFIKNYKNIINYFNFDKLLNEDVYKLSGGKLKLLSILRSLIFDRKIIIMDEPFNNLDNENSKKLETFFKSNFFRDKILIISNHNRNKLQSEFNEINI